MVGEEAPVHRVETTPRRLPGLLDVKGESIRKQLKDDHNLNFTEVKTINGYLLKGNLSGNDLLLALQEVFCDRIIEEGSVNNHLLDKSTLFPNQPSAIIQIGYKPGVTDNEAQFALDGLVALLGEEICEGVEVSTTMTYIFEGGPTDLDLEWVAKQIHNPLIQRSAIAGKEACAAGAWPELTWPKRPPLQCGNPDIITLEVSDEELNKISENRLLALNENEMRTIQQHYREPDTGVLRVREGLPSNSPTDVELEVLGQTWSEHCKHKIFAAKIHHTDKESGGIEEIDSLFSTYIRRPTLEMGEKVDWLLSVFHDNSGVIGWTDEWSLCMKVETHNSPSALDPFGGAITGIVGVNRDIMGTGLGARPVANTDVFCFGPPDYGEKLPGDLFHPKRVMRGVHAGVRVGGNESGIPTVNGAMVFDERYLGKPLVYCGTVGILPRYLKDGRAGHEKEPQPGDIIYMVGGRVGADGIHGATFSSLELTDESPSSAVQIGDPITQKKMLDMLLEARDEGIITALTDNGAGGLSSSVGEMAEMTGGCEVDLDRVPLKQVGLAAWEILVSESQERMSVSVHPDDCERFEALAKLHEVEATSVAHFTSSGMFKVIHGGKTVALLPLEFLHGGVPQYELESEWKKPKLKPFSPPDKPTGINDEDWRGELLKQLLARPNIASKEDWVRQYDHEVQAGTVVKPFVGRNSTAPGDAAVIAPIHGDVKGAVVSCGLVPRYSDIDAGAMAAASVDEAVRNAVCVGVDLDRMAGLDNFCWPDPVVSEKTPDGRYKLAQLVRANQALAETCRAYQLPMISGKDSMKNDYGVGEGRISVPPTLLVSLIGNMDDVTLSVTSEAKNAGDSLYLLGNTREEIGASEFATMTSELTDSGIGGEVPIVLHEQFLSSYRALTKAMEEGLVTSAHDCSDGGLAVALAEKVFGNGFGLTADLSKIPSQEGSTLTEWGRLFSESCGRILVTISPLFEAAFLERMEGEPFARIGTIDDSGNLDLKMDGKPLLSADVSELESSWKKTFALPVGGDE